MSVPVPSPFTCPQCRQADQVRHIAAVTGGGSPGDLPPALEASFSHLAQELAPPEEPHVSGPLTPAEVVATIVMICIAFPAFGLAFEAFRETRSLMAVAASDPLTAPLITWWKIVLFASVVVFVLCLVGVAVTGQRYYERRAAQRASWEAWSRARTKWEQLYYCGRCDGVFLPGGDSHVVRVSQTPELMDE
jgi:hypothetical protein